MKFFISTLNLEFYDTAFRLRLLVRAVCIFFLLGIIFSIRLWISERFFPAAPVADVFTLPFPSDIILLGIFVFLLVVFLFLLRRAVLSALLICLVFLLLQDQLRWQPWVYLYGLVLASFLFYGKREKRNEALFIFLQVLVASTYVWSGIHKLNPHFGEATFVKMLTALFGVAPAYAEKLKPLAYGVAAAEILIGIALFIPKTRFTGVVLTIGIHGFILAFLSPLGIDHNTVVYPWNVAMIVIVFILFYKTTNRLTGWWRPLNLNERSVAVVGAVIWFLPLLNFFGYWDDFLSFSLYSDKHKVFYVVIEKSELGRLDRRYTKYYINVPGLQGGKILHIDKWAFDELNVPFCPERRIFRVIARSFCSLGINEEKVVFIEVDSSPGDDAIKTYSFKCPDISH